MLSMQTPTHPLPEIARLLDGVPRSALAPDTTIDLLDVRTWRLAEEEIAPGVTVITVFSLVPYLRGRHFQSYVHVALGSHADTPVEEQYETEVEARAGHAAYVARAREAVAR